MNIETDTLLRLRQGATVSFASAGIPHQLKLDRSNNEVVVTTDYATMRIPQVVLRVIVAAFTKEKNSVKNTVSYLVDDEESATLVATTLIGRSAWFMFEPRPDGRYHFTVKAGEGHEMVFAAPYLHGVVRDE